MAEVDASARWERVGFYSILVLQTLPLVVLRWFPSEDGPPHIGTGEIIARHTGVLERYFDLKLFIPNATAEVLAAGLVRVSSPIAASRILVLLCAVGIPLGARYAFVGLGRAGRWISWLSLPLAIGYFVHIAEFSFCLGAGLLLVCLGWWTRHEGEGWRATGVLALLLLATLYTHLIPFIVTLVILAVRAAWQLLERDERGRPPIVDLVIAAALPTVLAAIYVVTEVRDASVRQGLRDLAVNLVSLQQAVVAYESVEKVAGLLVVAAVGILGVLAVRGGALRRWRQPATGLLAAAGVILVMYFVLPDGTTSGGGDLSARLSLVLFLTLMAWLSQFGFPERVLFGVAVAGVVGSLALTVLRVPLYSDFDREISEYVSIAKEIEPGSTVLPVNLAQDDDPATTLVHSVRVRPTMQLNGWIMAERHAVDLGHYEAFYEVNPPRFRDDVSPYESVSAGVNWIHDSPPDIDLAAYEAETEGQIDYVLVFGRRAASDEVLDDPLTAALDAQLDEGFELVAESSPDGLVELYRRTG